MTQKILVVDDEPGVRAILERVLEREGYKVLAADGGRAALEIARQEKPDVLVLDYLLPDLSGQAVCQSIRKDPAIQALPVLILTGQAAEGLPAQCLDSGADDYLAKPFDANELAARVRALLRRPRLYGSKDSVLERGAITIHTAERRVLVKGHIVKALSPKEFDLLYHIVMHAPNVLDKNTLALKAWGVPYEHLNPRTLDVHVRRIRAKLGRSAAGSLLTVPTIGYQWTSES